LNKNTNNNKSNNLTKLKVIELCSGIGAQIKGIKNTNLFDSEVVATADLDKEVVVSYAAIHCGLTNDLINSYENYPSKEQMVEELTKKRLGYDFKNDKPYDWEKLAKKKDKTKGVEKYWLADKLSHNLGDMIKIEELPDCDFLSYSCPCTDISISGKQEGLKWTCQDCGHEYDPSTLDVETRYTCPNCGSNNIKSTRSGLLYEVERLLVKAKENGNLPKYLLMENVDALVSKKYIESFNDWIERLSNLGYDSYYQTINAKNTGIPQNRNRIFCISILKDIDSKQFEFPHPFDTGIRLKDMLEDDEEVLDKYFLSDEVQRRLQITDEKFEKNVVGTTLGKENHRIGTRDLVYWKEGIIGCLTSTDYKQPHQILENPNEIKKIDNKISANEPIHIADLNSEKYQRMHEISRRVYSEDGIAPAMHTCNGGNTEPKIEKDNLRIVRKLTPKEAHRLMGFDDIDYENCKAVGMSDTQGYKQAGNSIVTNCISLLIEHLYKAQYDNTYICTDEKMVNFQIPQAE
jgi:DNA (cytosine-5)-methyltransferase 1